MNSVSITHTSSPLITAEIPLDCKSCGKPPTLCLCATIQRMPNRFEILILQHPQESDRLLGTAKLTELSLERSVLKIGLSWPNLKAALGKEAKSSEWGVLYLGSGIKSKPEGPGLHFVDKKGQLIPKRVDIQPKIRGLVLLDGTWSQAKALWWRNAWLLKLRRAVLVPTQNSLYKELRREPRPECLSTLEATAQSLRALGESPKTTDPLLSHFSELLTRYRKSKRG